MEANIEKTNDEFEIKPTRFYYSLEQLFGSPLHVLRSGRIIGQAKLLDDLPLNEGEKRYQTSYIGRLDHSDAENVTLRIEDVVVVRLSDDSTRRRRMAVGDMPIDAVTNKDENPWPRSNAVREFLTDKFPKAKKFYVGSVSNVSLPLARFEVARYFDLTIRRPRSGEEYISRDAKRPSLRGKYAYVFAGTELVGEGEVTSLMEIQRGNFVELNPLINESRMRAGTAIVIPVTDNED